MSPVADDLANILSAVVGQIRRLSDDEVKALVAREAEFRLVPLRPAFPSTSNPSTSNPSTPTPSTPTRKAAAKPAVPALDPALVRAELDQCGSEPDAVAYLQGLRLSVASAKALIGDLGLRPPARPTVAAINAEIVRVLVRGRLNAATVQRL